MLVVYSGRGESWVFGSVFSFSFFSFWRGVMGRVFDFRERTIYFVFVRYKVGLVNLSMSKCFFI